MTFRKALAACLLGSPLGAGTVAVRSFSLLRGTRAPPPFKGGRYFYGPFSCFSCSRYSSTR